ncbi:MAG TPA: hypothetical protein VKV17_20880 [Bryobacteraceae bacterium]|nr:hypothetical protein [Bryobacteraceae bacterium]
MLPQALSPRLVLAAALAIEGFLLLRPDGVMVRAARPADYRRPVEAETWWRRSPVHMGCSIGECSRPATRTQSYRIPGPRGITWRAYGFCERHNPPPTAEGLVYRLGRPPALSYDVPLAPEWAEIYFLLGTLAFALWCVCMWRWARALVPPGRQWLLAATHLLIAGGLWLY